MNIMVETSIRGLLEDATEILGSDTDRLDAEVLLASVLGKDRSHLHAWPEKTLPLETCRQFHELVKRRASGEPVAYLTGEREFWSLSLCVNKNTLIPRPETETLVALALQKIPAGCDWHIADLGTGSGAIALALAHERPGCRIIATDTSDKALACAADNAARLGIENVSFILGNWCTPLTDESLDLVISNPPYIEEQDVHLQQGGVRFEPRNALAAGKDGMDDLERITSCARLCLKPGGWLLLEHGYNQSEQVKLLMDRHGYQKIGTRRDLAGLERVCAGKK